ncbi:unnamed protein product, partial [Rotaria magnacalcarata]
SNFTLKILVLFGTENLKHRNKDSINFKFKIELRKQSSKSLFTIRDRNRISKFEIAITSNEKQIQNHRFASMAYETEHDFWLKISFPKPARRVFERV